MSAWQPLKFLINQPKTTWDDDMARHFIQEWLRQELKDEAIYCEKVAVGVAKVRAEAAIIKQEILLLEYDLAQELQKQGKYELKKITICS